MSKIECPNCGHPNEPGTRFCVSCGASTEPRVRCPACNHLQAVGNRFCMSCGTEMEGATWQGQPSTGAVIEGVWERDIEEFIRRVEPDDMRSVLGNRVLRVPPGTAGIVLVDGVVDRVLPPGQQTTVSLFERIANFFTRKDERTAFFLVDLRPVPVPFTITTRPTAQGRTVHTQVLVSFALQRGDKEAMARFIANILGDRPAYGARDLYQLLRPDVSRMAGLTLERMAEAGEFRYAEVEAELRRELSDKLSPRYGLAVEVSVAPLTATASLSFHLGTGVAPTVRPCSRCETEIPASIRFCDHCGARQPAQLSPDRRCLSCDAQVTVGERFCVGCGTAFTEPPATAAPLFTSDGEQVEADLVVRVQGQHQDFDPESIGPALVGGLAAHLREIPFVQASTGPGFAAMAETVRGPVEAHLQSYGLALISLAVVDIRSKKGQWLLGARADIERQKSEIALGREWLTQRAEEVDLAEMTFAQILRQKQVESAARLRELMLALNAEQRERSLRADDALARDRERVDARQKRRELADAEATLDIADAERDAARERSRNDAAHSVAEAERTRARQRELADLEHERGKQRSEAEHRATLERSAAELESERARRKADDAAYAARTRDGAELDKRARAQALDHESADRDQARQLDKLRAMAELDKSMADQELEHKKQLRATLQGMNATEMIAAQASELAQSDGGGADWAQAVADSKDAERAAQQIEQSERHAREVKELMHAQQAQMQAMMTDQLDRMQALTEKVLDRADDRADNAAAAGVYEKSMDAMARVASSRAAPPVTGTPPVVATATATTEASAAGGNCSQCGAELRPGASFCGACGHAQ